MKSQVLLFQAPCVIFGVAFLLHLLGLFSESRASRAIPAWFVRLGWLALTAGLALRWIDLGDADGSGLRFPWATPFEASVFLVWAIASTQIWFEANFRSTWTGALTSLACALILVSVWVTKGGSAQAILPLSRELMSPLFFSQVFFGAFGYAFLFVGACLAAFCFFDRESTSTDSILSGYALVASAILAYAFLHYARLTQPAPLSQALHWGLLVVTVLYATQALGGAYASRFVGMPTRPVDPRAIAPGWVGEEGDIIESVRRALRWLFVVCSVGSLALLGLLVAASYKVPGYKIRVETAPFLLVTLVFLGSVFMIRLMKARGTLIEALPEAVEIDRFSYRAISSAQALLSIQLVLGGFWAYLSRGQYWGWDAVQTYSVIALAGTILYTHGRLGRHERGAKSESVAYGWLALAGLAVALFAVAGANVLLPKPLF